MNNIKIKLSSVNEIKDFVNAIMNYNCTIDIISGRYVIDAKSIIGIFSLDLSKPLSLRIDSDDKSIIEKISRFIIK